MPAFRPSMIVSFKVRFDESLTLTPDPVAQGIEDIVADPAANAGSAEAEPLILRIGAPNTSFVYARIPKTCSVELPGYRQASKFKMTLDFRDMPIDPRTVRAASVEIHLGTVTAEDFAKGYRLGNDPSKPLVSVLAPRSRISSVPNSGTLVMVATVDEWEVDHTGDGSIVQMSGRDLRGILIDTPINAGVKGIGNQLLEDLDLDRPVNEVVAQILEFNPLFMDFVVVANPAEWKDGFIPKPNSPDLIPRHRKGAKGNKSGKPGVTTTSGQDGLKFWDLIVKVCYLVGAIPYMEGLRLLIRPSRSIYDKITGEIDPIRNPTPFIGGRPRALDQQSNTAINAPLRIRRLVYGRDLKTYNINRKFSGWRRPKYVRAVGFDPSGGEKGTGKVIVGIWPDDIENINIPTKVAPGDLKALREALTIPVPDIVDADRLQEIARAVFEEVGRGELGGVCETSNLSSFGGGNADADLLRIRPGAAVEMLVDTHRLQDVSPYVSTLTDFERSSFSAQVDSLVKDLGDINLARVVVATARGQVSELQRFFRVQNVKFQWNVTSGVAISFDFQNYVTNRNQIEPASGDTGPEVTVVSRTDAPATPTTQNKSLRTAGGR